MQLLHAEWLWLLPFAPLALACAWFALRSTRRGLRRFYGTSGPRPWSVWPSSARAMARGVVLSLALALAVVALARPVYNPKPKPVQRAGRDVVFLVDVSRSMLAQDLRPSRLEMAKLAVGDAMDVVEGERVGVIAFAGSAVVKSPLTTDLAFARMALDELSPDSVSRGGTAIGDAIRTAVTLLTSGDVGGESNSSGSRDARVRDIVLLTDGEDHETDPLGAAREAGELGIRVICVGLGSDLQGAEIPLSATAPTAPGSRQPRSATSAPATPPSDVLEHDGERVRTKMNPDALRQVAEATPGGQFFNVGTGSIELDTVYRRLMRDAERRLYEATPALTYTEAFQWPLLAALLLVLVEPLVSSHARRGTRVTNGRRA